MANALTKARQDPESMKAKILVGARRAFGQFGFHGATTRIIAREVGVDVSTVYYHWGGKAELYQAVIYDLTEDLREQFVAVEKIIHGKPLEQRMEIALSMMADYLFDNPQIANLILFRYFGQTRAEMDWDHSVPMFAGDIARSMGLAGPGGSVSVDAKMRVMGMMMTIYNFISGEDFFRSGLDLSRKEYRAKAKETMKFLLIPAFAAAGD